MHNHRNLGTHVSDLILFAFPAGQHEKDLCKATARLDIYLLRKHLKTAKIAEIMHNICLIINDKDTMLPQLMLLIVAKILVKFQRKDF